MTQPLGSRESREAQFLKMARERAQELDAELEVLERRRAEVERAIHKATSELEHVRGLLSLYGESHEVPRAPARAPAMSEADRVVEIIKEAGKPMHYVEIERQMRARGYYSGGGRNPANTLLAKYYNDPRLYRSARGTYSLREWSPEAVSVGTKVRR